MNLPLQLETAIELHAEGFALGTLRACAQRLSLRYRTETGAGARLLTSDDEAVAYAAVRMPATYGAVSFALERALRQTELRPETLLDVGAGTGAASWAAAQQLSLTNITCLEREPAMLRLGSALMQEESGDAALDAAAWQPFDLTQGALPASAELVVAAYLLGELTERARMEAAQRLWQASEQMLLLVEPGTPEAYAQMMRLRAQLLEQGACLAAPCPHVQPCPLSAGDWCHAVCRVARSKLHRQLKEAQVPYEDEKFTYLAFVRKPCAQAAARVLRHPEIGKGQIRLSLCTAQGTGQGLVTKKEGELFRAAKKAGCGDALSEVPMRFVPQKAAR